MSHHIYELALRADKNVPNDSEDLIVWPDGDFCTAYEITDFLWKSDDFVRVPVDSHTYLDIFEILETH